MTFDSGVGRFGMVQRTIARSEEFCASATEQTANRFGSIRHYALVGELAVLALLLLGTQVAAQSPARANARNPAEPIKPLKPIEETYDKQRVSGRVDVGVLLGSEDAVADLDQLYVFLPARAVRSICLELNTSDGVIWARAVYDVSGRVAGLHRLELPLKRDKELRRYATREVAVRVVESPDCEAGGMRVLPISWRDAASIKQEARLTVQVNSDAFETLLRVPFVGGEAIRSVCKVLDTKKPRVSYNRTCTVQAEQAMTFSQAEVRRRNGGSFLEPISIPIAWP